MGHITIADLQMEGWTAFVLNISWTVTIHSSSLAAAAVIWSPVRALLEVLLVSPAGHLVHGKVTWNRAPVGIPVGVSSCVAQLTADYISMATGPDIITDRSKVAVGVDCIHIAERLRSNRSSKKLHMETVVCCCRCRTCCCCRCGVCADTEATSLANWGNLNNK